jgi:hypothetical protein
MGRKTTLEHRYHRGTARESSGWRSRKQRDVVCDPFPSLTAERTPLSTQGADVLRSGATVMLIRMASLFHIAWSISSHQKLSRACGSLLLRWRSGRECDSEQDQPPRGRTVESQPLNAQRPWAQVHSAEPLNRPAPVRMTCQQANWRIGIEVP